MSTHTPGPWEARTERSDGGSTIRRPDGRILAITCLAENEGGEEANARLIAAAPELLAEAMLFRCLASSRRFQNMTVADALAELAENGQVHDQGAAIAKAKGEPPPSA